MENSTRRNLKAKIPNQPDFYKRRIDTAETLILELFVLQGVLMLYGFEKMSSVIYEYTTNIDTIYPRDKLENIPEPQGMQKFNDLRNEFYKAAHYYLINQDL